MPLREVRRRHVREHEHVVILQVREVRRQPRRRSGLDEDALFSQRPFEALSEVGVAVDQQDSRLTGGEDETGGHVVVEQSVVELSDERLPGSVERTADTGGEFGRAIDLLGEPETVLALPDRLASGDDAMLGLEDFDGDFVVVIAVDDDFDKERLAGRDLRRDDDVSDLNLGLGSRLKGHGVDADSTLQRGSQGVAFGFVAVAQQHDPRNELRRHPRRRDFDRRLQVRVLGCDRLGV